MNQIEWMRCASESNNNYDDNSNNSKYIFYYFKSDVNPSLHSSGCSCRRTFKVVLASDWPKLSLISNVRFPSDFATFQKGR